jgi:pyruvate-formate lyase-activating enzyme
MLTNIYHISYAPATKEASLFFWGCNFRCRGCLCLKEIRNFLLKENLHLFLEEPGEVARPPDRFLDFEEVIKILNKLEPRTVILEGQEASLDPQYPRLTEEIHRRFAGRNILCTNAYRLPLLDHTDEVQVSLKAFTHSLHKIHTGRSNRKVLDNFITLCRSGKKITVSSVLIPGHIEKHEIEKMAQFIAGVNRDIPYHILPYFKAGNNPWRRPTHDEMEEAAGAAKKHLNRVYSWTGDEELKYKVLKVF